MTRELLRVIRLIWGLFLCALGFVLTINANIGVSPWDVFHQGLGSQLGITIGAANIVTAIVIVVFSVLMKEHVGFGTLSNMLLLGMFIDMLMRRGMIPEAHTYTTGVIMMIAGLFILALGTFFYIGAGYGSGPRDSLMVVLTRYLRRPVGFCRFLTEGTALVCGWLLGGHAGIGTIIFAFGIGFAVQIVFTLLRFDVKAVSHETFTETCARLKVSLRLP